MLIPERAARPCKRGTILKEEEFTAEIAEPAERRGEGGAHKEGERSRLAGHGGIWKIEDRAASG